MYFVMVTGGFLPVVMVVRISRGCGREVERSDIKMRRKGTMGVLRNCILRKCIISDLGNLSREKEDRLHCEKEETEGGGSIDSLRRIQVVHCATSYMLMPV